jgi:hypothetical protein
MSTAGRGDASIPDGVPDPAPRQRFRDLMLAHLNAAYSFALYLARDDGVA